MSISLFFYKKVLVLILGCLISINLVAQLDSANEDFGNIDIDQEIEKLDSLVKLQSHYNDENTLDWLITLGNLHRKRGSYILAIESYENALELAIFLNKTRQEAVVKNSLGGLYFEINNKEKALYYCEAALEIVNINFYNNIEDRCLLSANLGNMYIVEGDIELAYDYLKQAEKLNKIINDDYYASLIFSGMGSIYLERKSYSEAENYLNKGLKKSIESKNIPSEIANKANLAKLYLNKGVPFKALPIALQGYESSVKIKEPYLQRETLSVLIEVYEDLRDFREAHRLSKIYQQLQNDIFSEDLKAAIVKSELSLKNMENEKSLLELTVQNERQLNQLNRNRFFLSLSLILFAASLLTIVLYFQKVRLKNSIAIQKLENKMIGLQLKPHFIFNVLVSIQGYMSLNDTKKASVYLSKFARLIRNVLEQSRTDFILLKSEIKHLNFYLELQQLRYDNRFSFDIEYDKTKIPEDLLIPPLLIQPIVENAVEHGVFSIRKGGKIRINLSILGVNELLISIEDNGEGISNAKPAYSNQIGFKKNSVSLTVIREQLNLFSKKYKQNYYLDIDSKPDEGTKVSLVIPCKTARYES